MFPLKLTSFSGAIYILNKLISLFTFNFIQLWDELMPSSWHFIQYYMFPLNFLKLALHPEYAHFTFIQL